MARRRKPVPARLSGGDRRPVRVRGEQLLPLPVPAPAAAPAAPAAAPPPPAVPQLLELDVLEDLRAAQLRLTELQLEIDKLCEQAYRAGHSFTAIGDALGVSRQAARQRHVSR